MTKNTMQLMNDSKNIAQQLAPLDTGNLRYNAIRAYSTPTGFRVSMLYTAAFYGAILNTPGPQAPQKHKGWWSTNVYTAVTSYVDAVLNNKQSNFQTDHAGIAKFAADDPERRARFYNSMVADAGRDKFIAGV
jgi:hypothetical protein